MVMVTSISPTTVNATASTSVCGASVSVALTQLCVCVCLCVPLLSQAVYKTGNEVHHLSHLNGVHRGTFCSVYGMPDFP